MKKQTREENVLELLNEWHNGFWNFGTAEREGLEARIAENVISWHGLKENSANMKAYVEAVNKLKDDGTLELWLGAYSGHWVLQVR